MGKLKGNMGIVLLLRRKIITGNIQEHNPLN
jgi:hypothetical protein